MTVVVEPDHALGLDVVGGAGANLVHSALTVSSCASIASGRRASPGGS